MKLNVYEKWRQEELQMQTKLTRGDNQQFQFAKLSIVLHMCILNAKVFFVAKPFRTQLFHGRNSEPNRGGFKCKTLIYKVVAFPERSMPSSCGIPFIRIPHVGPYLHVCRYGSYIKVR
jgi:hypothetical protein